MRLAIDNNNVMLCPACGNNNLHDYKVDVYRRDKEDGDGLKATIFKRGSIMVGNNTDDNPSSRRDGIRIHMGCEQCLALIELTIVQHKGLTIIETQVVGHTRHEGGGDE